MDASQNTRIATERIRDLQHDAQRERLAGRARRPPPPRAGRRYSMVAALLRRGAARA
jgi:hypothetical protein